VSEVGARRARYLILRVDPRTDTLPATLAFDVRYAPEQLLFVTRGPGPYVLAFGSYRQTAPAFAADRLLAFNARSGAGHAARARARVCWSTSRWQAPLHGSRRRRCARIEGSCCGQC
jgi:hypothetical protein